MEAEIVAQAGRYSAVTIATNMAGRGTDIVLGGNPEGLARQALKAKEYTKEEWDKTLEQFKTLCAEEKEKVIAAGGLHILGTERHESRRIDNQLRGRSGRQGDPGSSRFYLSLEDDLLRIFGSDRISGLMGKLGMEEDVPIEHRMVSRAIENAQKKVETHNFEIRKHILEYDDVMNQQRKVIYEQRRQILAGTDLKEEVLGLAEDMLDGMIGFYCPEDAYSETVGYHGPQRRAGGQVLLPPGRHRSAFPFPRRVPRRSCGRRSSRATRTRRRRSAPSSCATSRRCSCSRPWTTSGRTTSWPWTI